MISAFSNLALGDALLSHGEAPHYHRRYYVSLLSSEWSQVVPQHYGHQANSLQLLHCLLLIKLSLEVNPIFKFEKL